MTNFRKKITALAIGFSLTVAVSQAQASVSEGMDAMWNYTQPGTGGVNQNYGVSLGGLSMRSPVRSFNILAFDPPRFSAGCGGIDAYFGSFSMISGENIKNLIRAIISNAMGYAIKIALDNLCPPCQNIMSGLQDWTTKINSYAKNTCQLSTDTIDAIIGKNKNPSAFSDDKATAEAQAAAGSGAVQDFAEANDRRTYGGKNANRSSNAAADSTEYGNNLMNTLVSAGVFNGAIDTKPYGGDKGFMQMALSLYGTQILLTGANAQSSSSGGTFVKGSTEKTDKILEPIWTFRDVVEGGQSGNILTEYVCQDFSIGNAASCQSVKTQDSQYLGTKAYLMKLLIGERSAGSGQDTIMDYLIDNTITLSDERSAFLQKIPTATRDALSSAAKSGEQVAFQAASETATLYGEQMAADLVLAMNRTMTVAYSSNVTAGGKKVVGLSEAQRNHINSLEKEALSRLNSDTLSANQQNLVLAIQSAVSLTGNSGK